MEEAVSVVAAEPCVTVTVGFTAGVTGLTGGLGFTVGVTGLTGGLGFTVGFTGLTGGLGFTAGVTGLMGGLGFTVGFTETGLTLAAETCGTVVLWPQTESVAEMVDI